MKIKLFGTVTSLPLKKDGSGAGGAGGAEQARGATEEWIGPSITTAQD